jgi:hypothetical protein
MTWREALTIRIDLTPVRAEVSLAVTQGHVVAVYGLDLVEARPAIYEIYPVGVARVDKVVAAASVHFVVAVAGDDLVVAAAAPEAVVAAVALGVVGPEAALEAVGPRRPLRLSSPPRPVRRSSMSVPTRVSSPPVPMRTFARASCPAKNAPAVSTDTGSRPLPQKHGCPVPQSHGRNNSIFGTCRNLKGIRRTLSWRSS